MRFLAAVVLAFILRPALAADAAPGKRVFDRYCAECHASGFGHPGTQQLGWTRGQSLAVLESRTDLNPTYVATIVRHGLAEMPAFRPTEIDDATLDILVQYLTGKNQT
jgi:mono/diheme cytochrome c family protein